MRVATSHERVDDQVVLSGTPGEFRIALDEEIQAARRAAAGGAVQLTDGRRISRIGAAYQYQFSIESTLSLPDDSPGDLYVQGHPPLEVTIVSIEGMSLMISLAEDLGQFVPRARLQSNMVHLLRKLIERIEDIGTRENKPEDRLIGEGTPPQRLPGMSTQREAQGGDRAVAATLGFDTAFIWGPPGTGKTYTLGRIGAELLRLGRSLLLVSHTNAAVDQAILAIADRLGDALPDGSVIRVGEPRDRRLLERPRLLARTHIEELSGTLVDRREAIQAQRDSTVERVHELESLIELGEWAVEAEADIASLEARLRDQDRMSLKLTRLEVEVASRIRQRGSISDLRQRATAMSKLAERQFKLEEQVASTKELASRQLVSLADLGNTLSEAEDLLAEAKRVRAYLVVPGNDQRNALSLNGEAGTKLTAEASKFQS